ncbi:AC4 protein [West African Asystasia virus 1]|uniref:AC4 n=1 Tax=West African Asystasia virus 1 TaxID=1046573 RepID=G9CM28_9GEMI|nr:AC4 protein [West African Asystasia virus 1]AEI91433.1 AC4 protein [West African Asystasia virus 1]ALQ10787.1 AC4 [West African Asystasia virus 1]ALQ10796.1 AC4 [West African Asystasia virus 1]ALQ10803.1 AC4 [West African Asystasia virus 1]ALQ10812.1 AC4 [West African Asystasia virus 1]
MGSLISMCSYSSKGNTSAQIRDSSTWNPQPGQHLTIQTFRELRARQMSNHTSRREAISSTMGNSRSIHEVQEVRDNV